MSRTKPPGQWLHLVPNLHVSGSALWPCIELNLQFSGSTQRSNAQHGDMPPLMNTTPALVQEQNILDFLPYPPNALINAIRANYEMQCSLLYYSRNFPFQLSFPTCIRQHWTFISTSFFPSFIFYTQFQQNNAKIAKTCN